VNYLEHVTTYYVSLVGRCVSLSSQDLALVQEWEAAGVPAAVVCRALRMARQRGRRSYTPLSNCSKYIDRLRWRPAAKKDPEPSDEPWTRARLLERLAAVGADTDQTAVKQAYRNLYRTIRALPKEILGVEEVERLDEMAVSLMLKELSSSERAVLRRNAMLSARELLGKAATQRVRKRLAASLVESALCDKFTLSLPSALLVAEGSE
jgi:hypothetical protein